MLDAVDVEEVVLVVGDDLPLHLARRQPSEWLHNVEHGHSEVREDVYGSAPEGKEGRENERQDRHQHGERSAKCTSHDTHDGLWSLALTELSEERREVACRARQ